MEKSIIKARLIELYQQIPTMQCRPGCTRCCGFIPWSKFEFDQVEDKRNIKFLCVYPYCGRCSIYEQRPFICRLFGTVAPPHILSCPEGCLPAFPLTTGQARNLYHQYLNLLSRDPYLKELQGID